MGVQNKKTIIVNKETNKEELVPVIKDTEKNLKLA